MSESVGHVSFPQTSPHGQRLYGEQTASLVDTEVRNAIQVTMDRVLELLKEKKHLVEAIAERLLVQEVLEREDMLELLGPRPWAEKTSYDDFVAGTGSSEEITLCQKVSETGTSRLKKSRRTRLSLK